MSRARRLILAGSIAVCEAVAAPSALSLRGYSAIPEPRDVRLGPEDFAFESTWRLELAGGVPAGDVAVETLREEVVKRLGTGPSRAAKGGTAVQLKIAPGAVTIGAALDRDRADLASEAYRLELGPKQITITANQRTGLFYGVETLAQLLKPRAGKWWLPQAEIVDWPDLRLRQMYWDDAHHLERFEELQRAVRQAAFFKINGFALKLEGHFEFRSAPAIVEPQALSPAKLQELTDYGLRYHVQVIPYLDGPGHIAFILKHPEFARLREYPESNYEMCVANPDALQMLSGLIDDLIAANHGVKYFYLSTDEPYYVGLANNAQCDERSSAEKLGSVGKLLTDFIGQAAGKLREKGREVIFWGEYPLKLDDLPSLPRFLINGEVNTQEFNRRYSELGMRQMIYTSVEGEEKLFPEYFSLPSTLRLHEKRAAGDRAIGAFEAIVKDPARQNGNLIGAVVAGWADMGLHPEAFWLGYATATAAAWNPDADARQLAAAFYPLYFGDGATQLDRVYQLLSYQAQFWSDSWETAPSTARKPIFGNSYRIYQPPQPAKDQTLPLPELPAGDNLEIPRDWAKENAKRLALASEFRAGSDELAGLLGENARRVESGRYALEVFMAIHALCRQNLDMLDQLARISGHLQTASKGKDPKAALGELDEALHLAERIRAERNEVLRGAAATWYKSWLPRVPEANGRRFVHELDDVKDHLPDRTVDMSYLVHRELLLPMQDWVDKLVAIRNRYAESRGLPARTVEFRWSSL